MIKSSCSMRKTSRKYLPSSNSNRQIAINSLNSQQNGMWNIQDGIAEMWDFVLFPFSVDMKMF